jgi:hypothetical protein
VFFKIYFGENLKYHLLWFAKLETIMFSGKLAIMNAAVSALRDGAQDKAGVLENGIA